MNREKWITFYRGIREERGHNEQVEVISGEPENSNDKSLFSDYKGVDQDEDTEQVKANPSEPDLVTNGNEMKNE